MVKQCIQDLIDSGDVGRKITTFMAIATAKQGTLPFYYLCMIGFYYQINDRKITLIFNFSVIIQNEPELLEEYGGSLKLNVSWAKSFLRRIDANNMTKTSQSTSGANSSEVAK